MCLAVSISLSRLASLSRITPSFTIPVHHTITGAVSGHPALLLHNAVSTLYVHWSGLQRICKRDMCASRGQHRLLLVHERIAPSTRQYDNNKAGKALDQEAIRAGWPRPGMSADALFFLWGEPYSTAGDARWSAHWYDLGSSLDLAMRGKQYRNFGNRIAVYLMDGRVVGWVDAAPSDATSARG
jgi:hypothetical protein